MEVENGGLEDDFSLQGVHFPLPWLWEKGYKAFCNRGNATLRYQVATRGTLIIGGIRHRFIAVAWELGVGRGPRGIFAKKLDLFVGSIPKGGRNTNTTYSRAQRLDSPQKKTGVRFFFWGVVLLKGCEVEKLEVDLYINLIYKFHR